MTTTVVLVDYPLRLWAEQTQYSHELLRELYLLVEGERAGWGVSSPPAELLEIATTISARFGQTIEALDDERRAALGAGADRMDLTMRIDPDAVPLVGRLADTFDRVDEFCAEGRSLLILPRPAELVAFSHWTTGEIVAQHEGAAPRPWPGPF